MTSKLNWQVIALKDVAPAPWRNGGGTTRELLTWPDSVAWQWRVSVAEVIENGPFSSFAGVQRWFAVLHGDGVGLTVGGCLHLLRKNDQPLMFDGAAETTCKLLGGATQDFNLMVQGGTSARMQRVHHSFQMTLVAPKIIAVYASNEGATLQIGSEFHALSPHCFGWMPVEANMTIHVLGDDALLMEIEL